MTQFQLDFAVARATGETLDEIRHLGFGLADPSEVFYDPEPVTMQPLVVDWDELDSRRLALFP